MEPSIFPMFSTLHRTYPNIFTIFGPAHNFLHKIKHKTFLNPKEKGKTALLLRLARLRSAQVGPRAVRALPLLATSLTAGPHCQLHPSHRRWLG